MIMIADEISYAPTAQQALNPINFPAAKRFNPIGAATCLITETLPDGETLFAPRDRYRQAWRA